MDTAITIKDLILLLLGIGGIVLIIFLIVMVKRLIDTLGSTTKILKDVETISAIAAERTKDIDGIIENVSTSVSEVAKNFKGEAGIIKTVSAAIDLLSTLIGFATKKKTATDSEKKSK